MQSKQFRCHRQQNLLILNRKVAFRMITIVEGTLTDQQCKEGISSDHQDKGPGFRLVLASDISLRCLCNHSEFCDRCM